MILKYFTETWRYLNEKKIMLKFLGKYWNFSIIFLLPKSANVFLNKEGTVKLGDMNVSKVAKKGLLYTQTGTPYYAR